MKIKIKFYSGTQWQPSVTPKLEVWDTRSWTSRQFWTTKWELPHDKMTLSFDMYNTSPNICSTHTFLITRELFYLVFRQDLAMYVRLVWNLLCSLGWPQTHNAYFSLEGSRITGMFHCTWPGLDLNLREQTPGSYICETRYFSTGL